MSKFLVTKKVFEENQPSSKFIIGKQVLEIDDINKKRFSTIKKYFKTFIDIVFDSCGGNNIESIKLALGDTFKDLPIPTKSQHIFVGWFTSASGGTQITSETLVSLDINTLYAQWEEIQIDPNNCTSYSVTTTSSYKNTGIYVASILNSSQPIYIDWGDGTIEKTTSSISQKSHTYKTIGNFTVKISDNITSFAPSYNNSTWYGTTSQNRYTFKGMISTGSKVTSLPIQAFYYCSAMTNIDFMQTCWPTVTTIPNYCFRYCTGLTSIQGAKRFTSLGSYCFSSCTRLTGTQDLSEFKFTTLPNSYTFATCTNVTQWILPSRFAGTSLGSYTFYNDTKLSSLVLPNSLTSTGGTRTFQGCSNLKNINIPSKVQSIGNYAFYGCTQLSNVNIEATNLTAINSYAFYNCNKLTDLDLPDTVKTIGNYAFYGCTSLNYAGKQDNELPSQLTSIGSYAYQGCSNLKSLNIPENLQTIGDYAFAGCYQISSIVDKRLTAQTVSTNTFGNTTDTGINTYTGYQTKGNNVLSIYSDATGYQASYWLDPLQNVNKCGFNLEYIDPENVTKYCIITFDVGEGTITETTRELVYGAMFGELPKPVVDDNIIFDGWYTGENGTGEKITSESIVPEQDAITLYAYYIVKPEASYTVDLNDQWQASTIANPDSSQYDGVYESFSNYNVGSKAAVMYIKIVGYTSFTIYIRSYAESGYDYTLAFNLDTYTPSNPLTSNPSSSTSGVKAQTGSKQNSGTDIGSYTKVEYTGIDGGEHYICVAYRKDGSGNSGTDRGYVLIEKPTDPITINFDLNGGTLTSGSLTATGYQGKAFDDLVCPIVNGPSSKPYFIGWNDKADGSGITYNNSTILPTQQSITLYAQYIAENPVDPNKDIYLCFTAEQANSTIKMTANGSAPTVYLETSTTGNIFGWSDFTVGSTIVTLANVGDKVYFRAKQDNQQFATSSGNNKFIMTGKIAASGNLNTLLKADGSVLDLTGRNYCYKYMFHDCKSLTQAPALPATKLASECYSNMFYSCTSLTSAPELPAITLASRCYWYMFTQCYALTQTPELPAATLADYCYSYMFQSCTSLTKAPALSATKLARWCYNGIFSACKSLTQAPALPATKLADYCYQSMFENCSSLTQAPALPATTLADYCYNRMFMNCSALTQAPALPATTLAGSCYSMMFYGCPLTQAPELPATTLANYCYTYMFQGCSKLNNINVSFSAWDPTNATTNWVENVASSGTFTCPIALPETYGISYIPVNWITKSSYWGLCFTAEESNSTISMTKGELAPEISLYTSIDGRNWTQFIPNETTITLTNVGDSVYFKAANSGNNRFCSTNGTTTEYANIFSMTGKIAATGNIMSLLNGDNPTTNLQYDYTFVRLFQDCTSLTQAPELPAIELANYCYSGMFFNCTSLTQTPALPATTLTTGCYASMFTECSSLTQAPVLPATTLASECYSNMFQNCTSLIQASELQAKTLADRCYKNMFYGCISLTSAPELQTTTLTNNCYAYMFCSCTSLTQAPELPATELTDNCYSGMFEGCTSLTSVPKLPANDLIIGCYTNMFANCTSLSSITTNILEWSQADATDNWLYNVSPTGTFTCYENLHQERGPNRIPTNWTIDNSITKDPNLSSYLCFTSEEPNSTIAIEKVGDAPDVSLKTTVNGIKWLPFTVGETTITLANTGDKVYFKANENDNMQFATSVSKYNKFIMTGKVAASGNIQSLLYKDEMINELPATYCYTGLFRDCSALTQAPELPVEQLSTYCYGYMFNGCISLSTPPVLSSTNIANQCYIQMFANCSSLTSAPELPATQLKTTCYSNMFNGCTSLSIPPTLPATSLSTSCYANMFKNCISLTSMSELPATALTSGCYANMFNGCSSLTSINVNLSAWNVTNGTTRWLSGVSDTGVFNCPESLPETRGVSNIPTNWEIVRK